MHGQLSLFLPVCSGYPRRLGHIDISSSIVLIYKKLFTDRRLLVISHLDMHVGVKQGFKVGLVLLLLSLSLLLHFQLVHLGRLIMVTFLH